NDNSDLTLAGGNVTTTSLGLNAGNITTDGSNVLIVTGAITGGSADSYVNGPLVRGLDANLTGTTTVNFPIGKGGYNPLDLVNPVTGAGTVGVLAEVFDANSGGTPGNLLNQLNTARYWNVDIVDGAANFTGTHIRLNDTRGIFDQIASSATVNGTYELVGGLDPVLDPESITSSNPAISALAGYYLMAQAEASEITNILANPAGNECVNVQRTITATVTPGAGTVTGVVINYSVNSVPQTPITMTNTGGNNWEGIIPTVTPANATVVWSITATESTNLTATTADVTYQDEPIFDFNAEIVSNLNNQCAGTEIELVLNAPSEVNIGTGSTTSTTYSSPFYSLWSNKHQQIMYLASELTAAGMKPGAIKAITFYVNSGTMPNKDFSLKMAHTNATNMSAFVSPSFTTVFSVPSYQQVVGANTLEFDVPFNWNGVDNIVIEICFGDAGTSATLSSTAQMDNTSFVSNIKANPSAATGIAAACAETSLNLVTYSVRPRTTFTTAGLEPYTITWSDGTNTVGTSDTILVTPTVTTSYTSTITDIDGCSKTFGPEVITVLPLPAAPSSAVGSTQCGEGVPEAFATGGLPGTYLWYLEPTGGTALPGENNQALQNYSISTTTTFYVALTDGNCISNRVPVTATVNQPDAIDAVFADDEICLGEQADLSINQTGSNQTYTYTWTATPETGSGITNGTQGAPLSFTPTAAGTYEYSVVAVDGPCTTSASTTLTVVALPPVTTATATPAAICFGETSTLAGFSVDGALGQDTVGIPTTTLGGVNGNPYRSGNGTGNQLKTQLLYTAAEMQAAGFSTGNITGLGFITTSVGGTMSDMTIKIGATNVSNLTSTFETSTLTEVFTTPTFTAVANEVNFHPFSTPFFWDGSSNILVEVCQTNTITGTTTVRAYTPGFASNVQAHTSTTSCSNTTGSEVANKPVIVFEGIVGTNVTDTYIWEWNPGAIAGDTIVVNPASTEVYTATVTNPNTGCSNTSGPVTVTVNQLPEAPIGTDSEHCGLLVPDAFVSTGGANGSGVFNWYDAPTGGNLLQTGTDVSYLTEIDVSTTFYVSEVGANGCESERTPVNVTVIEADALTLTATATTPCIGSNVTLEVTQNGGNNTYNFTYTADPLVGSGITGSETGTSVIVVPTEAGTYTYTVNGDDTDKGCLAAANVQFTVNPQPIITVSSATPSTVCSGEQVNLVAASVPSEPLDVTFGLGAATSNSSGSPFYALYGGGKISYIYTAAELQAQGVVAGPINSMSIEVTVAGTVTYKEFTIGIGHTGATEFATAAHVTDPITNVFTGPLTDNGYLPTLGINTFNFSSPFVWDGTSNIVVTYCWSNADGGTTTASGFTVKRDTYTGQYLTAYTYADNRTAAQVCSTVSGGVSDGSTTTGGTSRLVTRTQTTFNAEVGVDITDDFTWEWNPGAIAGSEVSINPTSTETYTVTATDEDGCTSVSDPVVVTVLDLPPVPTATPSTQCGIGIPTASVTDDGGTLLWYDAPTGGNLLQTGGNTYTTAIDVTTTFYVSETDGTCESDRVAVTVTVTQPDPVSASVSDISICPAETATIDATQTGSNQTYVYTWTAMPETGSGLVNGTQGASLNITPTAAGSYEYTVTAFDAGQSCTVISSTTLVVNPQPVITSLTSTPPTICSGGNADLVAESIVSTEGTATIGSQTTTSITGSPYRGGTANSKVQYLFLASELAAQGIQPGNIVSVGFNVTSGTTFTPIPDFEISMVQTNLSALTSTFVTGLTTVYGPQTYVPQLGVNTHTLSAPFVWDGVSNIVIQVCNSTISPLGTSLNVSFENVGSGKMYYSTSTTGCATVTGTSSVNRPVMEFGGTVGTDVTSLYNYVWTPGNLTGSTVSVNPTVTTTYSVVATNPFSQCSSEIEEVTVTVAPVGSAASASATTSCAGSPVVLDANPTGGAPFTFSWSDGTNVVGTTEELTVNPTATTTYTVTVTDACNNSTNSQVTVNVDPVPGASIAETGPINLCTPATQTLTAVTSTPNPTYQWQNNGIDIDGETNSTYLVTASGVYNVIITETSTGCISTSSDVAVNINPLPSAVVMTPTSALVCEGGTPVALSAESMEEAIGTIGTNTLTSTTSTPFKGVWGGSKVQFLYRAPELAAMGMSAGSDINGIGMYFTAFTAPYTYNDFSVSMKLVTVTNLTATPQTGLTPVYGPVNYLLDQAAPFTVELPLSTPFEWDGTSNLLIEFCFNNGDAGATGKSASVQYTTVSGTGYYRSVDNQADFCTNTTGTWSVTSSRPNMGFSFTKPAPITWSPATGLNTTTGGTVLASPTTQTVYTATATNEFGCTASADVTVDVTPALTVSADIAGPTNATAHVGSLPVATYSIATTNETSITWDIPAGSTNVTGQGTNTISFNYPIGY
ncbi:MAG TPA: hypothetical protein PLS87_11515, partial [Ferruginibacter sp.]|nr:hypothetical protein [Ferruginibacter sp.]